jgi:hypothetical protein
LALARALNISIQIFQDRGVPLIYGKPNWPIINLANDDGYSYHALVSVTTAKQAAPASQQSTMANRHPVKITSTQHGYFPGQSAPNNGQPESSAQGGYKRSY